MTSKMYNKNDCMTKLIIAKLIILQTSAYIVNQSLQSYTYFETYSKIWVCWIQSKIWCWRDQTDLLDDRTAWYNFIEIRLAMLCWSEFWMSYNNILYYEERMLISSKIIWKLLERNVRFLRFERNCVYIRTQNYQRFNV